MTITLIACPVLLFQFQHGAIKSVADVERDIIADTYFNSNMVRLKVRVH